MGNASYDDRYTWANNTSNITFRYQANQTVTVFTKNLDLVRVLVIDTIGLLSSIYRYGNIAYIGGGFGVGIHNTIEAAVFGMPVIFGPNYKHFREACALIDAGGGKSVRNYREFASAMDKALAEHETLGKNASDYVESELGATNKIYKKLFG